jgi:DNA polymerase-4
MRKVIHLDVDAFFASVEQRDKPHLRGKPVIICHFNSGRGVVSTASYEARKYGVHSAMPTFQAKKLCPRGYFVTPDFEKYQQASNQLYNIFSQYTDTIEGAGIDEAYLEVTTNKKGIPSATWVAQDIRYQAYKETGLTVSAGVSCNKLLSKIASDFQKPNGLTVIQPKDAALFLKDLPVRKMPGIGPVTESYCHGLGIKKIGDFLRYELAVLEEFFGNSAQDYQSSAQGIDDRPLVTESEPKSCSIEDTLASDIQGKEAALPILESLAKRLEERLNECGYCGRTVTLKVKYEDHSLTTRRQTVNSIVSDWRTIYHTAGELLDKTQINTRPVRLLGIGVSQLYENHQAPPIQLKLFE